MKTKIIKHAAIILFLAGITVSCAEKESKQHPEQEELCLCDGALTIPVINRFLEGLSNDVFTEQGWYKDDNFEKAKLMRLRDWLETYSCISYVRIGCHGCMDGSPSRSRMLLVADDNGSEKEYMFEIAMSDPLEIVSFYPRLGCECKDELYYYHNCYSDDDQIVCCEKNYLDDHNRFRNDCLLVGFFLEAQDAEIVTFINKNGLFKSVDSKKIISYSDLVFHGFDYRVILVETREQKTCSQLKKIISDFEKSPIVAYAHYVFEGGNSDLWGTPLELDFLSYVGYFWISVKDENDLTDLYAVVQETNTWIVFQSPFYTDNFLLGANKNSKGDALQMVNYFHETGKFRFSIPGLLWYYRFTRLMK